MNERAVVISNSLAKRLNVQMGDWITMGWDRSESAQFYIAGIVNYRPGWDPAAGTGSAPMLVVADLSVVQAFMAAEPYEVWLKLDDHADIQALYDDMAANDIHPVTLRNFREENIALINGSNRLAVNGAITLGFIAGCIVCALGFLLYWHALDWPLRLPTSRASC